MFYYKIIKYYTDILCIVANMKIFTLIYMMFYYKIIKYYTDILCIVANMMSLFFTDLIFSG